MPQGRRALYDLLDGRTTWPPVVVPLGLDPFGWHGQRNSYDRVCAFALERCTLLPKVYPFPDHLCGGQGEPVVTSYTRVGNDEIKVRRIELQGVGHPLSMEEIKSPGDYSWTLKKPWIQSDEDLDCFLTMPVLKPADPDLEALRRKESEVGDHGLPYAEIIDPFSIVCSLFPTDTFYVKILTDPEPIEQLIAHTQERVLASLEILCREAGCPFIIRFIGAEMAVPPFLSRQDFLHFAAGFYREAARLTSRYGVPRAVHCHGPVREIMGDIWEMGYDFLEPFEPPPRGDVSIADALTAAKGRGIVFGGIDDVILQTGSPEDVRTIVGRCLDEARRTGGPYILSQSATPFFDPLSDRTEANLLLFLEAGTRG